MHTCPNADFWSPTIFNSIVNNRVSVIPAHMEPYQNKPCFSASEPRISIFIYKPYINEYKRKKHSFIPMVDEFVSCLLEEASFQETKTPRRGILIAS